MPGVQVGGLNIGIGISLKELKAGLGQGVTMLEVFQREMAKIRLEGVIKGDPFSATRNYMDKARKELDNVFSMWGDRISRVDEKMSAFAVKTRQNTNDILREYQKVGNAMNAWLKFDKPGAKSGSLPGKAIIEKGIVSGTLEDAGLQVSLGKLLPQLRGVSKSIDAEIRKLTSLIEGDLILSENEIAKGLTRIRDSIAEKGPQIVEEYKRFGNELRKSFVRERGFKLGAGIEEAKSEELALRTRRDRMVELRIEIKKLTTEKGLGISIDKNREGILRRYQELQQLGVKVSGRELSQLKEINREKARSIRDVRRTERAEEPRAEVSILKEHGLAISKLVELRRKLATTINMGLASQKQEQEWQEVTIRLHEMGYKAVRNEAEAILSLKRAREISETVAPGSMLESIKKRQELTEQLRISNSRLRNEMQLGIKDDKAKQEIMSNLNRLKKMSIKLTDQETLELSRLRRETKAGRDISTERMRRDVIAENSKRVTQLHGEERRLRIEMGEGINVRENQKRLLTIINELMSRSSSNTKKYGKEVKGLRKEVQAYNSETRRMSGKGVDSFLSAEWIRYRLKWFIQLRAAWAVYRKLGEAWGDMVEYQDQLARAMRTANSEFKTQVEIAAMYKDVMRDAVTKHGVGWENIGESLYQLTSAGLSSEEAVAGLNTALSLQVALEGDARETTKALAGIYNNFKDVLGDTATEQEKLNYIGNVVAVTWKHHQAELNEMIDGYKYASAMAKSAGVSFETVSAIIGVLNSHMIKGGRAGRGLQGVWARMASDAGEFARIFQMEEFFSLDKPLQFEKIMKTLHERFKKGTLSVSQLGVSFDRMGRRSAPVFEAMIKFWDEITERIESYGKELNSLEKIEKERLNSLRRQWKLFGAEIRRLVADLEIPEELTHLVRFWTSMSRSARLLAEARGIIRGAYTGGVVEDVEGRVIKENIDEKKLSKLGIEKIKEYESVARELREEASISGETMAEKFNDLASKIELAVFKLKILNRESIEFTKLSAKLLGSQKLFEVEPLISKKEILSDVEKLIMREMEEKDINKQILRYKRDIADAESDRNIALKEWNRIRGEGIDWQAQQEAAVNAEKKIKAVITLEGELLKLYNEEEEQRERHIEQQVKELQLQASLRGIGAFGFARKELEREREILRGQEQTLLIADEIKKKNKEINEISKEEAHLEALIAHLQEENWELVEKRRLASDRVADATKREADQAANLKFIADERKRIAEASELEEYAITKKLDKARIEKADRRIILGLEMEILALTRDRLVTESLLEKKPAQRLALLKQIDKVESDITNKLEEQKRATSFIYDIQQSLKEEVDSFDIASRKWAVQALTGFGEGVGTITSKITGGFQEQEQEVINLENELQGLGREYDEAINQGEVERAKDLTDQMQRLRENIEDLKDPIHTIGEMFRSFFKDLVDQIRETINKWIAMKIVMGIGEHFFPGEMIAGAEGGRGLAHGGMLPQITAFKKFSSGGITSRPTLALLGDNKSKQELIIPTENIKSDSVSGYMRDKSSEGVYIANFITPEDMAGAMSGVSGKNVIVNHVLTDMGKRGPIWKQVRMGR